MPKATARRERCIDGVCEVFKCDESQSNSSVREGKSDYRCRRSRADMHPSAEETLGMWLKDIAEMFEGGLQTWRPREGCQRYHP